MTMDASEDGTLRATFRRSLDRRGTRRNGTGHLRCPSWITQDIATHCLSNPLTR